MRQRRLPVALVASGCLLLSACVQKTEYDQLQEKLNDATKQLVEVKDSLKKSQEKLGDLLAHRYQTFTSGTKTWRLDTVKGVSCILLATDQDWKNPATKRQNCTCEDFYRDTEYPTIEGSTSEQIKRYEERVDIFDKRAKHLGCE
jgi:hypothetical protein